MPWVKAILTRRDQKRYPLHPHPLPDQPTRATKSLLYTHFTETREYCTVQRFEPEIICSDANFTAIDSDGFLFSIISSSVFMVWQRLVGGRIKSDYRFSNTIVWNNFPLGEASADERRKIIDAGQEVIRTRAKYPSASLESLYDPRAIPQDLLDAHFALDMILEKQLGVSEGATELDRQRLLLERYANLSTGKLKNKRVTRR